MKYSFLNLNHMGKRIKKKYIIGYNDDVTRPIRIFLPEMNGYVKCFDDNKTMSFLADDKEFLKNLVLNLFTVINT